MVEAGWSVVNPVLDCGRRYRRGNFPNYASGSWDREKPTILERDGRRWRNFEEYLGRRHWRNQRSTRLFPASEWTSSVVSERVFPSRDYSELGEIVSKFWRELRPGRDRLFRNRGAGASWTCRDVQPFPGSSKQSRLAKQIRLPATLLIKRLGSECMGHRALASQRSGCAQTGSAVGWKSGLSSRRGTRVGPEAGLFLEWAASTWSLPAKAGTWIRAAGGVARSNCCASSKALRACQLRDAHLRGPD